MNGLNIENDFPAPGVPSIIVPRNGLMQFAQPCLILPFHLYSIGRLMLSGVSISLSHCLQLSSRSFPASLNPVSLRLIIATAQAPAV